jgi:hypothetical protein
MKRTVVVGIVCTVLVLGGCSQMPRHFGQIENYPASNDYKLIDDPVSAEELCTLVIDGTLTLKGMGELGQIQWDAYGLSGAAYYLKITAGKKTLVFDYFSSSRTNTGDWIIITTSKAKGIGITYEFEPGHTYEVFPIYNAEGSVPIGIKETSFPVRLGWRMGPYLGWHRSPSGFPFVGPFILAQGGVTIPAGNSTMEFLAEANAGALGYNPFEEDSSLFNPSAQVGGTANFYFGKSWKKTGIGLGGGVTLVGFDSNSNALVVPYARVSFFPSNIMDCHIRLFADYSFAQEDELWKRFGLGVLFFLQ